MRRTSQFGPIIAVAVLLISALITLSACTDSDPTEPDLEAGVASLELSHASLSLGEGDSIQISAVARDSSGALVTGVSVTW